MSKTTMGSDPFLYEDIKRRFERSKINFFKLYRPLLDSWLLFDNSSQIPNLVAKKNNAHIDVVNNDLFQEILNEVGVKL